MKPKRRKSKERSITERKSKHLIVPKNPRTGKLRKSNNKKIFIERYSKENASIFILENIGNYRN